MIRLIFFIGIIIGLSCNSADQFRTISGETMGTTYSVTYKDSANYALDIKRLLTEINQEVSSYIPNSVISKFNRTDRTFLLNSNSQHFIKNWAVAAKISKATDGYFDPTVMPLINYWGFGYDAKKPRTQVDSLKIKAILNKVGLDKIEIVNHSLVKEYTEVQLDFSALAKGYAVDKVGELLSENEVENYFVEIGGEVVCKGLNRQGGKWRVGINKPVDNAALDDFELILNLSNVGLASSGNYRNFYIVDGKKYGHTIDPKTGYPVINELLGVAVVASNSMTADAYATSFMAMGLDKAKKLAESTSDLEACFFTSDNKGTIEKRYTNGFIQYLPAAE